MTPVAKYTSCPAEPVQPLLAALLRALGEAELGSSGRGVVVRVQGESLFVPARLACSENTLWRWIDASKGERRSLALCLGTRHSDGRVREACLREVLGVDEPWVAPFVVLLLGEYVVEIVEAIAVALPSLNTAHLGSFVQQNPAFMATTRRRATSYWNCYYRGRSPKLADYPAIRVLDALARLGQAA